MKTNSSLSTELPPEVPQDLLERIQFFRDPWNFVKYCMYTKDEADFTNTVKSAPSHLNYLETIVRAWHQEDKVIVDKSRRMFISWIMIGLHLHMTFTGIGRQVGFVSKKAEDADDLVERARFIYDHIPEHIYPQSLRPTYRRKENFLIFNEVDSRIRAVASGPDQMRQYGFSALFFDEFGFWPLAQETYTAAKPTLQGGGKITIVTTHPKIYGGGENFYRLLLEDRI